MSMNSGEAIILARHIDILPPCCLFPNLAGLYLIFIMSGRDGLLCQKDADYAPHSTCKADFTIEEVTAKEDYSHNTYRYHRYQNLSVQPIWHEDSSED